MSIDNERIWKEIFKTIDEMADNDNLEGWNLEGIKKLLKEIKLKVEEKLK